MNHNLNDIIYLKDFKSNRLEITKNNCVDIYIYIYVYIYIYIYIYHIDYFKDDSIILLYLKMLDFYGYIEIVNNIRIFNIAKINLNDSFLIDYKKVLNGIIFNSINSINGSKYVLNDNYLKIIVDAIKCEDDTNDKLVIPINCLLKF